METTVQVTTEEEMTQERIRSLLKALPLESLRVVEQFVRFLDEQARNGQRVVIKEAEPQSQPPYKYPTVAVPASTLTALTGIMPPVGGDALADTEALYDEA